MCLVRVFCCDCSLRSAAIVAAVFNAIVTACFYLTSMILFGMGAQFSIPRSYNRDGGSGVAAFVGGGFAALILGTIALAILLCLIRGIIKQKSALFLPWLIGDMINIVLQFAELISTFVSMCIAAPALLPLLAFQIAYLSFELYLWIVILSYYKVLENVNKNPPSYANLEQSV